MWWLSKDLMFLSILIGFQNVILAWKVRNILAKYHENKYFAVGGLPDIIFLLRKEKKESFLLKKEKNILHYAMISFVLIIILIVLFLWSMW